MRAYKAFEQDQTCLGFKFEEGQVYEIEEEPILCKRGFHFCKELVLTLKYYHVINNINKNLYAEVEILGDIVYDEPTKHKGCTNKIKIVRFLKPDEVLAMVDEQFNSGVGNIGLKNSGNYNTGRYNSGNYNFGDGNSGNYNSGWENFGNHNSGLRNFGHFNSKIWLVDDPEIKIFRVFDVPCKKEVWEAAEKPEFIDFKLIEGKSYKECFIESWCAATLEDKQKILKLPNFNGEKFSKISGINLVEL